MPSYCTLFCDKDNPAVVPSALPDLLGGRGIIELEGLPEDWTKIRISNRASSLQFTNMRRRQGGDELSMMILGLHNYFRNVETPAKMIQQDILNRVLLCRCAIGVVADPEFSEERGHYDCIFGLAAVLDALIWNGSGVLTPDGQMMLDGDGYSEVVI